MSTERGGDKGRGINWPLNLLAAVNEMLVPLKYTFLFLFACLNCVLPNSFTRALYTTSAARLHYVFYYCELYTRSRDAPVV